MLLMMLTFVLTTAGWLALIVFLTWRFALHLRDNPGAAYAVVNAIVELAGRKPEVAPQEPEPGTPEPQTLQESVGREIAGRNGEVKA